MNQECTVVFWDVQHGHSTYIKTPNNRHIVIDLGTGDYSGRDLTFSPLSHLKYGYGVNKLDFVVITHPHLDHIDDILNFDLLEPKVLHIPRRLSNEEVMSGVQDKDKQKFQKYCEINDRYSSPISEESEDNPSNSQYWGGLKIKIFDPIIADHLNINNNSYPLAELN